MGWRACGRTGERAGGRVCGRAEDDHDDGQRLINGRESVEASISTIVSADPPRSMGRCSQRPTALLAVHRQTADGQRVVADRATCGPSVREAGDRVPLIKLILLPGLIFIAPGRMV